MKKHSGCPGMARQPEWHIRYSRLPDLCVIILIPVAADLPVAHGHIQLLTGPLRVGDLHPHRNRGVVTGVSVDLHLVILDA